MDIHVYARMFVYFHDRLSSSWQSVFFFYSKTVGLSHRSFKKIGEHRRCISVPPKHKNDGFRETI
jgi:hypothetical protein